MTKNLVKYFLLFIITSTLFFLSFYVIPAKAETQVWEIPSFRIPIPGVTLTEVKECQETVNGEVIHSKCVPWISELIAGVYKFATAAVGMLAAIMLMFGGFRWLTAGGSGDNVTQAKSLITGALTGLALTMGSYMLLFYVNPQLTDLGSGIKVVTPNFAKGCGIVSGRAVDNITQSAIEKTPGYQRGSWQENLKADFDGTRCVVERLICCVTEAAGMSIPCRTVLENECPVTPEGAPGAKITALENDCSQHQAECPDASPGCSSEQRNSPCTTPTGTIGQCDGTNCNLCINQAYRPCGALVSGSPDCCGFSGLVCNAGRCEPTDLNVYCLSQDDQTQVIGGWCYNHIFYSGNSGSINQPCGDEPNNTCKTSATCNDWNMIGGRGCASGLQCCRP